ncbi:TetR/AcrR family transcriptional regulator [Mesorhizobium sp. 1B3]|uniref:TetR/AcrR family transcriptional regulator n=1 Tax=Mesorhizobium sp. 1B3 TaxID=3243599 RepID=UPI003D989D3C
MFNASEIEPVENQVVPTVFDFVELMTERAELQRGRPKRVRTRAKILAAAAQELALKGYEGLTVEGICAGAEMARGTFYLYYGDRSRIAVALFRMFWTAVYRSRPRLRGKSLDERVRVTNSFYLALYARNATFLAAQASLAREKPEFARWHDQLNHRWSLVIAANMPGNFPSDEKVLRARALVAMADELLANIFTARTPSLRHWADHPDRLADCLTAIWTRVVVDEANS